MTKTLFIDTETTGLPKTKGWGKYYDPILTSYYDESRVIEVAYIIYDNDKNILKSTSSIIRPNGFVINNSEFHGISNDDANEYGIDITEVLKELEIDLDGVTSIIGHNIDFDINLIMSECHRANETVIARKIESINKKCTMRIGKSYMNSYKYPKLTELYRYLFNKNMNQEHRALSDTRMCVECYYKMEA